MGDSMAAQGHAPDTAHGAEHSGGHAVHHGDYVKIWGILVVLLVVSVVGPMAEIRVLTLITAFGIAVVKAFMVAKHFMHLTVQPKYVGYLMLTSLGLMFLFFAGVSPDVMKHEGQRWENVAAKQAVQRAEAAAAAQKAHGGGAEHSGGGH